MKYALFGMKLDAKLNSFNEPEKTLIIFVFRCIFVAKV